ncbi:FAD-dependent oxidoreductase [Paenibacillus sp. GCM10027629]|uniref:FAD-dependent oxidoreductase n=1 Tax=Paenibacillus sp. GCM10027629 TaxID=3273414 RepID=UPI003627EADE
MKSTWKGTRMLVVLTFVALMVQLFIPTYTYAAGTASNRYDVVVVGSEIQGVLLAKSARSLGLNVLILDPRNKPGGELVQGQMMVLDEPNDKKKRSLVQGELKNLYAGYKAGTIRTVEEITRYYEKLLREIPIRSGITIESLDIVPSPYNKQEKSIQSLTYRAKDGKTYTVQSNYWVENTDHNALTGKLDLKRIPGMEQIYKGKKPDYMAATFMLKFKNVNWRKLHADILKDYPLTNLQAKYGPNTYVDWKFGTGFSNVTSKYKPQDSQLLLRGLNITYQKDGYVLINSLLIFDVDPANPKSVESAVTKAKAEAPHILKFLQKNVPGFAKAELNGFPDYLYIRDYNRFETEYVLHENDLTSSRMFWDNVSIGGYGMDLQGTKAMPKGINVGTPDRYGLPLRSFELAAYENVLVVGKNIGATIKAYGSARIVPNTALAAQTIGIILGKESKQKRLKALTEADFKRIHQYLEKDFRIKLQK